ncbi:hypothetical protein PFISCL1PPCAC_3319, partial [Pristionchus fissidentatus]
IRRVARSLFIVAAVDLSGWILTPGLFQVIIALGYKGNKMFAAEQCVVNFINIALAVKFFIYYSTSTDYRSAFQQF